MSQHRIKFRIVGKVPMSATVNSSPMIHVGRSAETCVLRGVNAACYPSPNEAHHRAGLASAMLAVRFIRMTTTLVSPPALVVVGMRTADGERFFVGRRVQGRIATDDEGTEQGAFPPELPAPMRASLEAVGITPYAPVSEAALREKLTRLGWPEPEIDGHFAEARKWMTHISIVWPTHH